MSSKLTLYIDDDLIEYVKSYAKRNKSSVSKVVNNYFALLKSKEPAEETERAPLTKSLRGVLRDHEVSEEDYREHLERKYL
jgi:hypothetical protein